MGEWLPLASFVVQCLILFLLAWYAYETWRIRQSTAEQAEAQHRPFLVLRSMPRGPEDAILEMGGIVGATVLLPQNGQLVLLNVGTGPALNVSYEMHPLDDGPSYPRRYIDAIPPNQPLVTPTPQGIIQNRRYEFLATYNSLSGRSYQTTIRIENLVLTNFQFTPAPARPARKVTAFMGRHPVGVIAGAATLLTLLITFVWWREATAKPDFAIKLEVPFEKGVQIRPGWHETLTEVYVPYERTFISVLTVQNVGRASARNIVISVEGSNEAIYGLPADRNRPAPNALQVQEVFRHQQRQLLPKESFMQVIPVTMLKGAVDGAAGLSVSVEADNIVRRYDQQFVFRKLEQTSP